MSQPLHIFISYAHADEAFKNELTTMLALLKRQGWVKSWDDRQIDAGSDWRADIMGGMDSCDLALLLISPAFLASEFIQSVEMTHLLARRKRDGIRVVPIILRPCLWHLDDIAQTQGLPKDGRAVITYRQDNGERDQVWTDIGMKIVGWAKEHKLAKAKEHKLAEANAEPGASLAAGASASASGARTPVVGQAVRAPARADMPSHMQARAPASNANPAMGADESVAADNMGWAAELLADAKKRGEKIGRYNPFNPWQPALPPDFCGRDKVLRQLAAALDEKRSVSIVGDWRIGKSSLLATWHQQVAAKGRTAIWITGEGAEAASCGAMLFAITGNKAHDAHNADACADILANWARAQPVPPLLVLDEADHALLTLPQRWFERLRGMIGQGLFCLVLSTCKPVDTLYQDAGHGSPFMNVLQQIRLGLLEEAAAEQLMRRAELPVTLPGFPNGPGLPSPIRWLPPHWALMRHWAGRHPFYLTLLAHYFCEEPLDRQIMDWWHTTQKHESGAILPQSSDSSHIDSVNTFRDEADRHLRALWASLSENERAGLRRVLVGQPCGIGSLKLRGLVMGTEQGEALFGEVLAAWMREMG